MISREEVLKGVDEVAEHLTHIGVEENDPASATAAGISSLGEISIGLLVDIRSLLIMLVLQSAQVPVSQDLCDELRKAI